MGKDYHSLGRQIAKLTKSRDNEIKKEYRRDYFHRIHNEEMERQLKKVVKDEYVEPIILHQLPERTQLQEVICDLSKDLTTDEFVSCRIRAINLTIHIDSLIV
jgi:Tfp pilus assembly protein PilO